MDTSLDSSTLPLGASVEAGVGIFIDFKTTSNTLSILLFIGVIVVVAADVSFGNSVTVGGLRSFGCSSARQILASTVAAGIVSRAKGISLARSVISIFSYQALQLSSLKDVASACESKP
jgi:hypothetical protein